MSAWALSRMVEEQTYRAKCNGGGGEADQASITGVRLVDSIGILIAQLIEDGLDPRVVFGHDQLTNDPLEPTSTPSELGSELGLQW